LRGVSSSWTWQYRPSWRLRCFLKSRVSPVIIVFRLTVSEIPPLRGKWFNSFTAVNTMCIVISLCVQLKGRLCCNERDLSFTTLICLSISGTCSLALVRLTLGPLDMDWIRTCNGANSPSTSSVVMWNPRLRYNLCISSFALYIVLTVLLAR
jgi:hypothetical protein